MAKKRLRSDFSPSYVYCNLLAEFFADYRSSPPGEKGEKGEPGDSGERGEAACGLRESFTMPAVGTPWFLIVERASPIPASSLITVGDLGVLECTRIAGAGTQFLVFNSGFAGTAEPGPVAPIGSLVLLAGARGPQGEQGIQGERGEAGPPAEPGP